MARIEFTVQIRNPENGIVTNEARIDLIFPNTAIGDTEDLERAVNIAYERAVQALAWNHASATYVLFTRSRHGHHAHVIVTRSASFEIPEQRFDQLRLSVGEELNDAEIGERVADVMGRWLAQPANADYIQSSVRPVAVFHDARAADADRIIASVVPRYVADCIGAAIYNPDNPNERPCMVYSLDPLFAARWCQ